MLHALETNFWGKICGPRKDEVSVSGSWVGHLAGMGETSNARSVIEETSRESSV
jgi:hypothetical protein